MRLDFSDIKSKVTIEQVCTWLGIELKKYGEQLRGKCPVCNDSGPRAFVVTPARGLWKTFCDTCDVGGDSIALVAAVNRVNAKEAAAAISGHFLAPPKQPAVAVDEVRSFDPKAYVEKLEFEHEAVQALGISVDMARELSIGFCKKGIMASRVVFPIRFDNGSILGFAGFCADKDPPLKLPKL